MALPENVDLDRRGCLRLTDVWLLSLEHQAEHARGSLVFSGSVVHGLQSESLAFASLPSFDYHPSDQDFVIMPGPEVGGYTGGQIANNSATQRSLGVRPPGSETDPSSLVSSTVARRNRSAITDDGLVDSESAAQVADDDVVEEQELPTIPPTFGRGTSILDLPVPLPPPVGLSQKAVSRQPPAATWVAQAAYFPSAPPPTVRPKVPPYPSQIPKEQQATLPGLREMPSVADDVVEPVVDLNDVPTLERMVESSDQLGEPNNRIRWREMLAALLDVVPNQKGHVLVEAANIALHELKDVAMARDLVERAIGADGENVDALILVLRYLAG